MLYLSMILGIAMVLAGKLNKVFSKPDFSWTVFWITNFWSLLLNLLAGVFLVINQAELIALITKVFPSSPFVVGGLFSGICGIAGITIVQFLVDIFNKDKKTVIGVNKD